MKSALHWWSFKSVSKSELFVLIFRWTSALTNLCTSWLTRYMLTTRFWQEGNVQEHYSYIVQYAGKIIEIYYNITCNFPASFWTRGCELNARIKELIYQRLHQIDMRLYWNKNTYRWEFVYFHYWSTELKLQAHTAEKHQRKLKMR